MVDFNKLLGKESKSNETDPILIFDRLDKESDKPDLRRNQETILSEWYEKFLNRRDTLVKLHTGQGKTLVGLLMLQSSMNAGLGSSVFLCPHTYLVRQTIKEAKSFGIKTTEFSATSSTIPMDFLNSKAILVTTCQKLFNGKSVFGVTGSGRDIIKLGAIVMDDAHTCIDIIKRSFSVEIRKKDSTPLYNKLWHIFSDSLMNQKAGTCDDILGGKDDAIMEVPFWDWHDKHTEVLSILGQHKDKELLFVWDLIKNNLLNSTCIFSGKEIQISPRLVPIDMISSFSDATRRIFLSATLTEDAFLVKDLNLEDDSVIKPLTLKDVTWSGERMILMPALLQPSLTRERIIEWISRLVEKHGDFGVVSLVPSNKHADDWVKDGGRITDVKNLEEALINLRTSIEKQTARTVTILVNKYDGIDLPDSTCRILCLDSMPSRTSLTDRYTQNMRPDSPVIRRQLAQRLEQGMGRAIRGTSDWCIVVITGNKLTSFVSERAKREFLSSEAKTQIEIAEHLAEEMKGEEGNKLQVLERLVNQCLNRDPSWRDYYRDKMNTVKLDSLNQNYLQLSRLEREAEIQYRDGQYKAAAETVQKIIDSQNNIDDGWYFQLMATYLYPSNQTDSMDKQIKAYSKNSNLHKPPKGITYSKLSGATNGREKSIINWIKKHESHSSLVLEINNVMGSLTFNTISDSFENAIKELGTMLGFPSQRPEKTSDGGSDNLWNIFGKQYWVISCKNMVDMTRDTISKRYASQLDSNIAWFQKNYDECTGIPVLIHPAKTLDSGAHLLIDPSYVITKAKLELLKQNVQNFYNSFQSIVFEDISTNIISKKLAEYSLDRFSLNQKYLEQIKAI